jgi:hypothetical protein
VGASLPSSLKEGFDGSVGVIAAMMSLVTMVRAVQGSTSLEEFSVFVGVEVFNT